METIFLICFQEVPGGFCKAESLWTRKGWRAREAGEGGGAGAGVGGGDGAEVEGMRGGWGERKRRRSCPP